MAEHRIEPSSRVPEVIPAAVADPFDEQALHEALQAEATRGIVHRKLAVGAADDPLEEEADRVAAHVMRMPQSQSEQRECAACEEEREDMTRKSSYAVARKCAACEEAERMDNRPSTPFIQRQPRAQSTNAAWVKDDFAAGLGPGQPLGTTTRAFFEPRFGAQFGDVRVHAGMEAARAADSIGAKAFTVGNTIAFAEGQYAPETAPGRELLAHELVHVAQQTDVVMRQTGKAPTPDSSLGVPKSSDIKDVIAFYRRLPPTDIKQYFIVDSNTLRSYDKDGKIKEVFHIQRPGLVEVKGYYLGNPFYNVGWGWVSETPKGALEVMGLSSIGMQEIKRSTEKGEMLRLVDQELTVIDWIKFGDIKRFWETTDTRLIGMAIMNTPLKALKGGGREGPILSHNYPAWFRELKTKVEERIAADRSVDKRNPNLPDRIFFYGSDRVQAQKGPDAWTIEVDKGKRGAYLTTLKGTWDEAPDKDEYAQEVTQELYEKVKLIVEETRVEKDEEKDITEIDSTGPKKKGDKWGWAIRLRKEIEALLSEQKRTDPSAKDFPDKLSIATEGADTKALAYLRAWVYDETKSAKLDALPVLKGGTIHVPLKPGDKAESWAPIVRKAADALRRGAVTTGQGTPSGEFAPTDASGQPGVLPPYPALIHPRDLNPDRTTATIATNEFRMVVDISAIHGSNLLNLTTIQMGMNIGYSWKVYPLPDELNKLKGAAGQEGANKLVEKSNEFVHTRSKDLGEPKETYEIDYDWDQSVSMNGLGEGEFLVLGKASIYYPSDWNMTRAPSVAALPFTVMKAEDIAAQQANTDSDALAKLKAQLELETDQKQRQSLIDQINELERREGTDLLTLTRNDAAQTKILIDNLRKLRKFIEDDRNRKLKFSGTKEYDPFMFRLKAFDKSLYLLYILMRQVYDFRYGDLYAIDEYAKLIQQQYDDLKKLETRTLRLTDNPKLRTDLPQYRSVAGLVKEDDGNLVPLILVVGHHTDSKPADSKYKMLLMDVTFDAPKKGDMAYAGGERSSEEDAVKSAFVEFGEDNHYGDGKVVYRVPQKGYRGEVDSVTMWTEYLSYALAVIGIVLLIAGTILSAGALAPGAATAIGALATALGIAAGVAGAALAIRNIYKRNEKGTFELDAEFALDVIAIIGAAVQVVGTVGKLATISRGIGAAQRLMKIQRLDRLLVIYGTTELAGNAILVGLKVKEDVEAVKSLHLPPDQEDEMMQQIAMDAVQQGAMLVFAGFSHAQSISEHLRARVEERYLSFMERGWIDEHGKPTELAPPSLREHATAPGKASGRAAQGEQAWKETQVLDMAAKPTQDQQHKLTVTENGRIIRCSDFCTDLRLRYGAMLGEDPELHTQMTELETRAKQAAEAGDKVAADKVAADAQVFEGRLKQAEDLRHHLFGMSEGEIDAALEVMEPGEITGGEKSGWRIDDVKIPKRQRRQMDVPDVMTDEELKSIGKGGFRKALDRMNQVMGKKLSEIDVLKKHWEAAAKDVLKGKQTTDYTREEAITMYKSAQRKFWENVRGDAAAVDFLNKQGFEFEGESGAALAKLGPRGKETTKRGNITNQERRISLDHIEEKAQGDNWKKALDADNLELMFHNPNSWKEIVQVKFKMREPVE